MLEITATPGERTLDLDEHLRAGTVALPFGDGTFDAVVTNGTVALTRQPERVFAEVARVLRPGGRLALADDVVGGAGRYAAALARHGLEVTAERRGGYVFGAESVALAATKAA